MTKSSAQFKKTDLRRAISCASQEGLEVRQAEIDPDGTIRLQFGSEQSKRKNDWD